MAVVRLRDCPRWAGEPASPRLGDSLSPLEIPESLHAQQTPGASRHLLVIGTLLTTAFGFSLWAKRQALDEDNWVDTSSALLEDDDIRTAVGLFIIDRLYQSEEVEARIAAVLPPRLVQLAKPAAAGTEAGRAAERRAGSSGPTPPSRPGKPLTGPRTER